MNTLKEYLTVERIGHESGVNFTMEVYKTEDGFYRCYAYAMVNGCKVTDWQYYALDQEEAYSEQTKDYLIREIRPMLRQALININRIANQYLANY
jgi:hypothetical protein